MQKTITLDNGVLVCTICHARASEEEPSLVHTSWCTGLNTALKDATKRAHRYAWFSGMSMCLSLALFIGVAVLHSDATMDQMKHEVMEHVTTGLFPPSVYYDPTEGKMMVLTPPMPHKDEGDDHEPEIDRLEE